MVKLVGDSSKGPGEKEQFRPKVTQVGENLPANTGDTGKSLGREDPLQEGTATHCSILVWRIPWKEEPAGLGVSNAGKGTVKEDFRMRVPGLQNALPRRKDVTERRQIGNRGIEAMVMCI